MAELSAEYCALVQHVPLFASLPEELAAELAARAVERSYSPDQVVFAKGDPGLELLIIRRGAVRIFLPAEASGEEVILAVLTEGDFFGELSLFDGQPRAASAVALEATTLLALHQDDFSRLLYHPRAAFHIIGVLSHRLRSADERLAETAFLGVRERLAKRLWHLAQEEGDETGDGLRIRRPLTPLDLAHMIGATPEPVQHELNYLARELILTMDGDTITITKPGDLHDLVVGRTPGPEGIALPEWLVG
jgi:CRP/FNR family transcriptional regulator, cyclic AMP receptor protein